MTSMRAWMEALVSAKGSDLHLKVGSPPRMRVDGRLVVLDGPVLTPEMADSLLRELIRPDLHDQFQQTNEADFAYSLAGRGPVPGQRLPPARLGRAGASGGSSVGAILARRARPAPGDRPPGRGAPRPGAGHRPDRLGQDHHPRRHDRPHQHQPRGPHRHDRGPHRGPARRQAGDDQPARGPASTPTTSPSPCGPPCARTPTSSWSARCATPRPSRPRWPRAETGHLVLSTLHTTDAAETVNRSSTSSRRTSRSRSGCRSPPPCAASSASAWCRRADGRGRSRPRGLVNTGRIAEAIADPERPATSPRSSPRAASTACRPSTSTSSPCSGTA